MNPAAGKKKLKAEGIRGKKRQKADAAALILLDSPLSSELFTEESVIRLRKEHDSNRPYNHVVFHNLCNVDRMRKIHGEALDTMTATFKETDLFKV